MSGQSPPENQQQRLQIAVESDRPGSTFLLHHLVFLAAPRIAVRVNSSFEVRGSGMRMGGGAKPFGVDAEKVVDLLEALADSDLQLEGLHVFSGSQNLSASSLVDSQKQSVELALQLLGEFRRRRGDAAPLLKTFSSLNIGGGFGIPYFESDRAIDLAVVGRNLAELCQRLEREQPNVTLKIELGRYIVGEAGAYVTRVLDHKESRGKIFLVVDFPSSLGRRSAAELEAVTVVGPLCTPLDILAEKIVVPRAKEGDFFVVFQSGAYGATASPQAFLSHPRPVEILL